MFIKEGLKNAPFSASVNMSYSIGKYSYVNASDYTIFIPGINIYKLITLYDRIAVMPGAGILNYNEKIKRIQLGSPIKYKNWAYEFKLPIIFNKFFISPIWIKGKGDPYFEIRAGIIFPFRK